MAVPVAQIQSHYHQRLALPYCHTTLLLASLLNGWSPFAPRVRFGKLSSSARPAVSSHLKRVCESCEKKPQIPPLRCAPVEMTKLLQKYLCFQGYSQSPNEIVISTGEFIGFQPTQGDEKRGLDFPVTHRTVIPTEANPDFLPRSSRQCRVCASP